MNSMDEYFRAMLREEISATVGEELQALREELAELKKGPPPELRGMITLDQLTDYLGVCETTARKWCHQNEIKLHKVASNTRVLGEDVHRVLKK